MKVRSKIAGPQQAIRLIFLFFSLAFLAMALLASDRANIISGLVKICTSPGQLTKSFFESVHYGGISGTFFNVALVGFSCTLLFFLPGAKPCSDSVLGFFLTTGFAFWGITALNIWFCFAGVCAYSLIRRERFGKMRTLPCFPRDWRH